MNQQLEVDPSIIENNLRLPELNVQNDELESLFPNLMKLGHKTDDDVPWVPVKPSPGFCVKCRSLEGDKIFINICHTPAIPEPPDIGDEKLIEILESEEPQNFKVPMSIGSLHIEADKFGNPCSAYDIAVNSKFYGKLKTNELFRSFFLAISLEGIQDKFSIKIDMESSKSYVVLKNKTVMGTLQTHNVQQRPVKKVPAPLISEISSYENKPETVKCCPPNKFSLTSEKLKIVKHPPQNPEYLVAVIHAGVPSGSDLKLHVGEDRIVVTQPEKQKTLADVFIEQTIDQENTEAIYDTNSQVLKVKLPLLKQKIDNPGGKFKN